MADGASLRCSEETGLDNGAPNGIWTRSYLQNKYGLFTPGDAELKCKDEVDKMDAVSVFARLPMHTNHHTYGWGQSEG